MEKTVLDVLYEMKGSSVDGPFVTIECGNTTFEGSCGYFTNNWSEEMRNIIPLIVDKRNHIIIAVDQ